MPGDAPAPLFPMSNSPLTPMRLAALESDTTANNENPPLTAGDSVRIDEPTDHTAWPAADAMLPSESLAASIPAADVLPGHAPEPTPVTEPVSAVMPAAVPATSATAMAPETTVETAQAVPESPPEAPAEPAADVAANTADDPSGETPDVLADEFGKATD
jgi:hypothetical protein